ncbi:MAG: hypothetical protein R3A10_07420 [Caldilineaceae bacterium]
MPTATPTEYAATDADAHAESDGDHGDQHQHTGTDCDCDSTTGRRGIDPLDGAVTGVNTVSGRATPGAVVQIAINGSVVTETTADEQGRWESEISLPTPGLYAIGAQVVDEATGATEALAVPIFVMVQAPPPTATATPRPTSTQRATATSAATATPLPAAQAPIEPPGLPDTGASMWRTNGPGIGATALVLLFLATVGVAGAVRKRE